MLTAIVQMREVLASEATAFRKPSDFKFQIDGKGTIIFTLPDGGIIRDAGPEIHFSAHHERARDLAAKLAQTRWGLSAKLDGCTLTRKEVFEQPQPQAWPDHSGDLARPATPKSTAPVQEIQALVEAREAARTRAEELVTKLAVIDGLPGQVASLEQERAELAGMAAQFPLVPEAHQRLEPLRDFSPGGRRRGSTPKR
jgi:hypothetical protein